MTSTRTLLAGLPALGTLFTLPLLSAAGRVEPLSDARDIATLLPERTLAYVEAPGLPALARAGLDHPLLRALLDSELGALALEESGGDPEALLAAGELALGRPVLPSISSLSAHGAALGVSVARGVPAWVLVAHGDDDLLVDELLERASIALEEKHGVAGLFDEPHATVRGADLWYLGETVLARRAALIVFGSDKGYVRDVLDLAADADAKGLLSNEHFRSARATAPADGLVWAFADRARIEELPGGARRFRDAIEGARRPQVQYLLGPGIAALAEGDAYSAGLRLDGMRLEAQVNALGARPNAAVSPSADEPAPAAIVATDAVLSAVLYRDLAGLHAHRAELFEPEALPRIAQGASQLALLFGGMDLGEELFPHLSPWLRIVARPAKWGAGPVPEIELPAAALVIEVDDAEAVGPALVSAFQNAIGITNVQRAQESMAAMTLGLSLEGDVQITSARFPRPGEGDGVDVRYNLAPACALVGRSFVIGTHDSLVRALVRDLAEGRTAAQRTEQAPARTESLRVSGPALAAIVTQNRDALVAQKVLEEGLSPAAARKELDGLHALLDLLADARLEVSHGADRVELSMTVWVGGAERARDAGRETRDL